MAPWYGPLSMNPYEPTIKVRPFGSSIPCRPEPSVRSPARHDQGDEMAAEGPESFVKPNPTAPCSYMVHTWAYNGYHIIKLGSMYIPKSYMEALGKGSSNQLQSP